VSGDRAEKLLVSVNLWTARARVSGAIEQSIVEILRKAPTDRPQAIEGATHERNVVRVEDSRIVCGARFHVPCSSERWREPFIS
jgi:hypothetical protein